jgi:hypothetical protein
MLPGSEEDQQREQPKWGTEKERRSDRDYDRKPFALVQYDPHNTGDQSGNQGQHYQAPYKGADGIASAGFENHIEGNEKADRPNPHEKQSRGDLA